MHSLLYRRNYVTWLICSIHSLARIASTLHVGNSHQMHMLSSSKNGCESIDKPWPFWPSGLTISLYQSTTHAGPRYLPAASWEAQPLADQAPSSPLHPKHPPHLQSLHSATCCSVHTLMFIAHTRVFALFLLANTSATLRMLVPQTTSRRAAPKL